MRAMSELFLFTAQCGLPKCCGDCVRPCTQHCTFVALLVHRQLHPAGMFDYMAHSAVSVRSLRLVGTAITAICARPARGVCAAMFLFCYSPAACARGQPARGRTHHMNHKHPAQHVCALSTMPSPTFAPAAMSSLPSNSISSQPHTAKLPAGNLPGALQQCLPSSL